MDRELEIVHAFLSGEFEPLSLDTLMEYLKVEEAGGRVRLIEKGTVATFRRE